VVVVFLLMHHLENVLQYVDQQLNHVCILYPQEDVAMVHLVNIHMNFLHHLDMLVHQLLLVPHNHKETTEDLLPLHHTQCMLLLINLLHIKEDTFLHHREEVATECLLLDQLVVCVGVHLVRQVLRWDLQWDIRWDLRWVVQWGLHHKWDLLHLWAHDAMVLYLEEELDTCVSLRIKSNTIIS
jgi:hypothetical protein